jgi:hypothetical protein
MKRDLRNYARQTNLRLIAGALLILLVVGEGLIYLIYGPGAAVTGLLCIGAGLFPVILIVLIFSGIDWIIKRANRE